MHTSVVSAYLSVQKSAFGAEVQLKRSDQLTLLSRELEGLTHSVQYEHTTARLVRTERASQALVIGGI